MSFTIAPPTHQWVTQIPRPWTVPASNGDREVLTEVTRRGSSATDLSVGQDSHFSVEDLLEPKIKFYGLINRVSWPRSYRLGHISISL